MWSFVDYQRLQKYFHNLNITLNYSFICKIYIMVTLSGNAPGSIKCPYFDTIILPTLKFIYCIRDIQLLSYHKMTKLWTPSQLVHTCLILLTPYRLPWLFTNSHQTPTYPLQKQYIMWFYNFITSCCNQHLIWMLPMFPKIQIVLTVKIQIEPIIGEI